VHGNSLRSFLVAVIVPEKSEILKWGKQHAVGDSFENLLGNKELMKDILDDLARIGKEEKVKFLNS
jgi:long-subunit acyl-CoA synthetase (AMP-forming)